jgi:hypothetical protein
MARDDICSPSFPRAIAGDLSAGRASLARREGADDATLAAAGATIAHDQVLERLNLMLAILQLAHQDAITRAAIELRADPVNAAILDACAHWTGAAVVYAVVKTATSAGAARCAERALYAPRVLGTRHRGGARVRATGLISNGA